MDQSAQLDVQRAVLSAHPFIAIPLETRRPGLDAFRVSAFSDGLAGPEAQVIVFSATLPRRIDEESDRPLQRYLLAGIRCVKVHSGG